MPADTDRVSEHLYFFWIADSEVLWRQDAGRPGGSRKTRRKLVREAGIPTETWQGIAGEQDT